jgi:hypothetical protein
MLQRLWWPLAQRTREVSCLLCGRWAVVADASYVAPNASARSTWSGGRDPSRPHRPSTAANSSHRAAFAAPSGPARGWSRDFRPRK